MHTPEHAQSTDGFSTYWSKSTQGPSAAGFEKKTLAKVPGDIKEASEFLLKSYGYNFPVLLKMQHVRAARAVAAMVHEAFNPDESVIGVKTKIAVATIVAEISQSKTVIEAVNAVAPHFDVDPAFLESVKTLAATEDPIKGIMELLASEDAVLVRAQLVLAHSASWSPTRINTPIVLLYRDAKVSSPALVEIVAIVSMLQMLHRPRSTLPRSSPFFTRRRSQTCAITKVKNINSINSSFIEGFETEVNVK